ncbi:hypothetical protein REPUB_Repub01dG0271800 [Reevesia pubescens]
MFVSGFVDRLKSKGAGSGKRGKKAAKDPNKPKRPASAFFVFMEEFRKQYKEEHPDNKSVSAVGKAGVEKWKSMAEVEKAPYVEKAEKRKTEYNKKMQAYNLNNNISPFIYLLLFTVISFFGRDLYIWVLMEKHSWLHVGFIFFSILITNLNMAVEAIQAIGNLARGLRTHFSGSSHFLLPILLVEGLQDLDQSVEIFIRLPCAVLGWNEKNVQVQQQVIEVVTYLASSATRFPKKCVVLCLLGDEETYESHIEHYSAPEEHVESAVEISRLVLFEFFVLDI